MRHHIIVIGGGVVGLFCAYFLLRRQFEVTVLAGRDPRRAASWGNAGYLAAGFGPSHPPPKSLLTLARWALSPSSHVRASLRFMIGEIMPGGWLWEFLRGGRQGEGRPLGLLRQLCVRGVELFKAIVRREQLELELREEGLLEVFRDEKKLTAAKLGAQELRRLGARIRELSAEECLNMEPCLSREITGGLLYEEDAWANPQRTLLELRRLVTRSGGELLEEEAVLLDVNARRIERVRTERRRLRAESVVLAAGARSSALLRALNLRPLVAAARGYGIICTPSEERLARPVMCGDLRIATSQLGDGRLKATASFELDSEGSPGRPGRHEQIAKEAGLYLPPFTRARIEERWVGYRPCTPDGFPLVGRSTKIENLLMATGHCRLGLTTAAVTGELLAKALAGEEDELLRALSPSRYGL